MSREARARFLAFATSPDARWPGNFRDFNGAILRMATLAPGGRITTEIVEEEIGRLRSSWRAMEGPDPGTDLLETLLPRDRLSTIDEFDRLQLKEVVRVCQSSGSLSEAGRRLFGVSRTRRAATNDADRLRKYLVRFGLDWKAIKAETQPPA
jgi:transcriptional regulatory protein RtcR